MDMTTLPASEAIKAALRAAAEGLRISQKIDLLAGADWALSEIRDGEKRKPGPLPVGKDFLRGRAIVHSFCG